MKRLCKALALTLCAVMLLSTITVVGDSGGKTILTLEQAKKIALENDTQYKIQDSYVKDSQEDYNDMADRYTGNSRGSNVAEKAANRISTLVNLDNAYNAIEIQKFNKNDIKRVSDYDVTIAYYNVMKAKYSLDNATRAMELAKKDLEIGKIQFTLGLITKTTLSQLENAYKASQTTYNSAFSDFENAMSTLSKEIGQTLDVTKYDIEMTIGVPVTSSLDANKLKEDFLKNNSSFFGLKNALDSAKYKKSMVDQEFEDYEESVRRMNEDIKEAFEDMQIEADRDFDDAEYQYNEAVKNLEITIKTQLSAIATLQESVANIRKSYENAKTTFEQNKAKYELGLISRNEFEKSESALKDVYNQLYTAIVNLNAQYLALTQYSYTQTK